MTIPMWMLLGFAAWTVLLLSATVGVYRWTRILSGRAWPVTDVLSILVLISRVLQSLVHVSHVQTDAFVAVRFSLLCVQLISFVALIILLVRHAVQL